MTGKDGCRQTGEDSFSAVLRRLMKARRMSAPRLADRSWLDSAYVWRQPPALLSPTWKLRALKAARY